MDLGKLTALQLAEKIKQHQISVLDGVKYVFDQIEAKEDKVHAYLDTYKKEAYARAKEVQKGIEDGTYTGPLAGAISAGFFSSRTFAMPFSKNSLAFRRGCRRGPSG